MIDQIRPWDSAGPMRRPVSSWLESNLQKVLGEHAVSFELIICSSSGD